MPAKSDIINRIKELGGDPTGISAKSLLVKMLRDLESASLPSGNFVDNEISEVVDEVDDVEYDD